MLHIAGRRSRNAIEAGDSVHEHMQASAKNATYLSKTVQNNIVSLIGDQLTDRILAEVQKAKYYSVLMDEVTERLNWEQLAVVLQYVDAQDAIQEKCMGFMQCESVTGEALAQKITDQLQKWGLPIADMRGQWQERWKVIKAGSKPSTRRLYMSTVRPIAWIWPS